MKRREWLKSMSLIQYPFPTLLMVRGLISAHLGIMLDGTILTTDNDERVHARTIAALKRRGWIKRRRNGMIVTTGAGTAIYNWINAMLYRGKNQRLSYRSLPDIFFGERGKRIHPNQRLMKIIYVEWKKSVMEEIRETA